MLNSIYGTVTGKNSKQLFLENNGIEFDICMPDTNLEVIGNTGTLAKVYVWLQHSENVLALYGFSSLEERSLFLDLLKVDGVGPKGAVKIMSSVSSSRLEEILESGDTGLLEKIPGVGKKTAGKMMLALKGKLSLSQDSRTVQIPKQSPFGDLILSLTSMGYDKKAVEQTVYEISSSLETELSGKSQKEKEDFIFRKAIIALS